jgi:cysteine desulfurase/selenocysteine lyase
MTLAPRTDFPLLAANPGLHYLDSAATAQKPQSVLDAVDAFYKEANANPRRGAYAISYEATQRYQHARETIAKFLGASDPECLVFVRGTTEAMNLVAATAGRVNVGAGDNIVTTALEHHASFVTFQRAAIEANAQFRIAELNADHTLDLTHFASLLDARTKIVAVTHVSNALGLITPIAEVVKLVRQKSPRAVIVLDGAQSAPHLPVHFDSLGVDFYAFSGHKLGGPMGIGGLIGRKSLLESLPPYQTGGDMIETVGDQETKWNAVPFKFEAGTPNAAGAVGLAAACDYLTALGPANVRAHEVKLISSLVSTLSAIEGVTVHGPAGVSSEVLALRSGAVSFELAEAHPHDLATILDQHGVAIRAGHHCCQPLMRRLGVAATARASVFVYSGERDVQALGGALEHARAVFAGA